MMTCRLCSGEEFDDPQDARDHVTSIHADLCTEELQEFVTEAEDRVYQDLISE